MKKTLRTGKKVCSVFLAVLMVITAWVFVAPEKAEAAARSKLFTGAIHWESTKMEFSSAAKQKA